MGNIIKKITIKNAKLAGGKQIRDFSKRRKPEELLSLDKMTECLKKEIDYMLDIELTDSELQYYILRIARDCIMTYVNILAKVSSKNRTKFNLLYLFKNGHFTPRKVHRFKHK